MRSLVAAIPFLAVALPACSESGSDSGSLQVSDSAGVQIVENHFPAWAEEGGWVVESEPRLEIGAIDGPEEYTFSGIGEAHLLSDGRIAVTNRRTSEFRFFSGEGGFLDSSGREGEGQGEFVFMQTWRGTADTLFVFDAQLARVSILNPAGEFIRSTQVQGEPDLGNPSAFGSIPGGGLFVTSGTGGVPSGARGLIEGNEILFSQHSAEGRFQNVIARFPSASRWVYTSSGMTTHQYLPYSVGWTPYAWAPGRLFVGLGTEAEIEVRGPDGRLIQLFRWGAERQAVGAEEMAEYREQLLTYYEDPNQKRYWEGWLREVPFPEHLPIYSSLLVDRTGHLWAEQYRPFWDESRRWFVFNPDGIWLGTVETPQGFRVTEIGMDYVVGVGRDELDVEYVRVYDLVKG